MTSSKNYDVIVVGAGIIGLSVAYYLARRAAGRILVLEKAESWATGSTPRANGGFRQQFSTPINIRLSQLSVPVFENFQEEFESDINLRQYGYLFVTATDRGRHALQANCRMQQSFGVPVNWVEPREVGKRFPFLRSDDLLGGTFCARDGYADSYSIAAGFGKRARELGVELAFDQQVTGFKISSGTVQAVRTSKDLFAAGAVVNSAGPEAAEIGRLAGLEIPVEPVRRMLLMTEDFAPIPEDIPMIVDADTGFLMRKESGKVLMGWSDPDEPAAFNLSFDPAFIDEVTQRALPRVPLLQEARVNPRRCWAGLYAVSPDHHCILGEAEELKGFYLANGFSGHGMMHSPAVGMILADLIVTGRTSLIDPGPLRLSRFREGALIHEMVVL